MEKQVMKICLLYVNDDLNEDDFLAVFLKKFTLKSVPLLYKMYNVYVQWMTEVQINLLKILIEVLFSGLRIWHSFPFWK